MKIKGLVVSTIVMAMILGSCAKSAVNSAKIKTRSDSLAYALGTIYYNGLVTDSLDLDPLLVAKAMFDVKSGTSIMTDEEARTFVMLFINDREADKLAKQNETNKALYQDYITENEEFLEKNKERPEVKVTESGLQYELINSKRRACSISPFRCYSRMDRGSSAYACRIKIQNLSSGKSGLWGKRCRQRNKTIFHSYL